MIAATVLIISACYSKVIELFPGGGGGYLVATKLLGPRFGVVSGCALIVDYVLTISTSVASGRRSDLQLPAAVLAPATGSSRSSRSSGVLVLLNLRGIKESVQILVPIFLLFVATHFTMIVAAVVQRVLRDERRVRRRHPGGADDRHDDRAGSRCSLIILRAYSLGGGAYTGIEAVSNGIPIIREPKVPNAKRTMLYMALSLAFTAGRHHAGLPADGLAARSRTRS